MLSVLSRYQTFTPRFPDIVRSAIAGAGAGSFAKITGSFARKPSVSGVSAEGLSIETDADATLPLEKLALHTRRLAEQDEWDKLSALISSFDLRRATFGGKRLAWLAADGASVVGLGHLSRAIAARPSDMYLAAISALAHIRAAEVGRAKTGSERKQYEAWVSFYHHVEQATDLMEGWAAEAAVSPLLAAVQHLVATHHDYAPDQIDESYRKAMAADPLDWDVMGAHARALLQSGSRASDRIEIAAREHVDATVHTAGAAAYAAFYLGLLGLETDVLSEMDTALFERGLADMIAYGEHDSIEINRIVAACMLSDHVALRPVAVRIIRENLRSLIPALWPVDESDARQQIALAYAAELKSGQSVSIASTGVETAMGKVA